MFVIVFLLVKGSIITNEKGKGSVTENVQPNNFNIATDESLFEKKQACASYRDEIWEDIREPTLVYDTLDPQLEEIFYSPVRDSCLYVFEHLRIECEDLSGTELFLEAGCIRKTEQAVDFLTKDFLFDSESYYQCLDAALDPDVCKSFDEKLNDLR